MIKIISGIGILIAMYLVLNKGDKTAQIITTLANNATIGIRTLQGRD